MSSASQFFGGGRIKSIQRGVIFSNASNFANVAIATITPVDTTKSILYHLGSPSALATTGTFRDLNISVMLTLENSTTIFANFGDPGFGFGFSFGASVSWQLVEYY